jgi:hypothetical protein
MLGILTRILPHVGFWLNPDNNNRHFKWTSTCYCLVIDWSWDRDWLRSTRGTSWDGRKVWRSEYSNWAWPIINFFVYKYEKCSTGREVGETVDDSNLTFYNIFWLSSLPSLLWLPRNLASQGPHHIRMATVVTFVTKVTMVGGSVGGTVDGSHCKKFPSTSPSTLY